MPVADRVAAYVLPLGLFVILTGMMWVGDRHRYHLLFYWLVALPTICLAAVRRRALQDLLRSPIFLAFAALAGYTTLSIAWSGSEEGTWALVKQPLSIFLLFVAFSELGKLYPARLHLTMRAAALVAVAAAGGFLALFAVQGGEDGRLSGYGALSNPLLTSHVFGFFTTLWMAYWIKERKLFSPASIVAVLLCGALIFATGSRTPLVALTATVLWLSAMSGSRRELLACGAILGAGIVVALAWPETVMQRGLSYRPQIWAEAIRQIADHPLLGHGFGHPLRVRVEGINYAFWDPHNLSLAVLYQGGAIGFALWAALYVIALTVCWRRRSEPTVFICSAPVVFGLIAGMTEGRSFLSGPKEHWFLIWIPLALLTAVTAPACKRERRDG